VTIVRPSIIFGPNDRFFNLIGGLLAVNPVFPIFGNSNEKLQPVYVGDVAQAIIKILDDPQTRAQVIELGGPTIYTYKEIVDLITKTIKRKRTVVNIPYFIGQIIAGVLQLFPKPLMTNEQLRLLQLDNVVDPQ